MSNLKGDVSKVEVVVRRELISVGPLFPKRAKYTAEIKVYDDAGDWEIYEKDFGTCEFKQVLKEMDRYKADWISKGLHENKINFEYKSAMPS